MKNKGFTLIELMVVVIIMAIITAILVPNYQNYKRKNDENIAIQALAKIALDLEREKARNFSYNGFSLNTADRTLPQGKVGDAIKYEVSLNRTLQTWTLMACVNDKLLDASKYTNFAQTHDGRKCEWKGTCVLPDACK